MKDDEFSKLQLATILVPQQAKWPPPDFIHWQKLHAVVDEARKRVSTTFAKLDAIDNDTNLTNEGKRNASANVVEQAVADFEKSSTLTQARDAVARQMKRWADKLNEHLKPAGDIHTATIYAQIRDHIADMKNSEGRMAFLQKHAGDPLVASALLTAPAFLCGLTDAEAAMIRSQLERRVLSPEILEARAATEKAMGEAERGWSRAVKVIAERGGLEKKAA